MTKKFNNLLEKIKQCQICQDLPLGPKPIVQLHPSAKIMLIGQAPGTKAHTSGIAWNDASGKRLREWLGVTDEQFYDATKFAIMPMGFCYPGKGKSGDLPPRKICAPQWHPLILSQLKHIQLTIVIGQYSQNYYLHDEYTNLTERVKCWRDTFPEYLPIPHPSPRNRIWLQKNPWFTDEVIPTLQKKVHELLAEN